jgi:molybdate transport system regulatory protein
MRAGVRFHIRDGGRESGLAIGPGKIALLEAIAETGSITAAAKSLRMSYRRAWLLVDETNRCLLRPAVEAAAGGRSGGRAALTTAGADLVRRYRRVERRLEAAVARSLAPILRAPRSKDSSAG